MIRTQIYLTEEERKELAVLAAASGRKQSELIRDAVDIYIHKSSQGHRDSVLKEASGMWQDRKDIPDLLELRKKWDRD